MRPPYRAVLCPTDFSPAGEAAVATAYALAARGGTVHLLHVTETVPVGMTLAAPHVASVASDRERAEISERARQRMARLVPGSAERRGVATEFHVVDGFNPAVEIADEVRRLGVDVVVMGTYGRTGLGRILLGSVAADVVRRLDVPVVLVHAPTPKSNA